MKYIVFWVLAKLCSVAPEPTVNPYGIETGSGNLSFRLAEKRDTMQKEFDSRADALAFIEDAKPHRTKSHFANARIDAIWLDSVSAEPEKRGVTFRIADENVTTGSYWTSNPHIITAELRPDFDIEPYYKALNRKFNEPFSTQDSIAALRKEVAELRAIVETLKQSPSHFAPDVFLSPAKLNIQLGASPQNNAHGN